MSEKSVFSILNDTDVSDRVKTKNGLSYLPWSSAWAEVKQVDPNANFKVYPQVMDEGGNTRFWHDDGKSGWVEVGVTVNNQEIVEHLAIMDFKNAAIPSDKITSVDANKAMKRCLVKAIAMHGLGLHIYEGEDLPENVVKMNELLEKVSALAKKRVHINEAKTLELCKEAEKKARPDIDEELIRGDINNIGDADILEDLYMRLLAVKK